MAPSLTFSHLFRQFAQATFDLRQVFESLVSIFLIDQKKNSSPIPTTTFHKKSWKGLSKNYWVFFWKFNFQNQFYKTNFIVQYNVISTFIWRKNDTPKARICWVFNILISHFELEIIELLFWSLKYLDILIEYCI